MIRTEHITVIDHHLAQHLEPKMSAANDGCSIKAFITKGALTALSKLLPDTSCGDEIYFLEVDGTNYIIRDYLEDETKDLILREYITYNEEGDVVDKEYSTTALMLLLHEKAIETHVGSAGVSSMRQHIYKQFPHLFEQVNVLTDHEQDMLDLLPLTFGTNTYTFAKMANAGDQ